ncbi:MAG: OmcA/MtrC family decaheme c-type cytochrome [Caldimonas sp.]
MLLAGCSGGDTGATGAQGPAGPPGPPSSGPLTSLTVTITGVTLGATSTLNFSAVNQSNVGYAGLPASTLEVTLAKLVPGTNGDPQTWQSYINTTQTPTPGVGPGTQPTVNATTDSGGSLTDHGDGTYTYTFGTNIAAVASPIAVSFDPTLTHRVALAIRSSTLPQASNGVYDWQPSTGNVANIPTRDMIDTASCNSCHDHLAAHGGPRQDARLCVTCHNPGSTEANSGNTLDFEVMIHKIHDGKNLPSVKAGTPYVIYGFRNSVNDFSDVAFPQDVRNCTKCHDPANPKTPDAHLAFDLPTIQACGACHDNIDFAQGAAGGHPGGVVTDNSECTICHSANRVAGSVADVHLIPGKVAAANFKFNILGISNTAPGQQPLIVISVTNPQNGNSTYDIKADPAFTAGGGAAALNIDLAWSTADYGNVGSNSYPGQPVSINALKTAVANGDGTYTVTSPLAVPISATGSGAVAIEGHPAGDFDGNGTFTDRVPVTSVVQYFAITDAAPTARRAVVDVANCQNCHGQNDGLSLHGNNRTDNVTLCVMCHNPNATDISQRPIDPDGVPNQVNTATVDGLEQRPIDFNALIHSIHGAAFRSSDFVIYGFGGSVNSFSDVLYPGTLANCSQCHSGTTYEPPLAAGLLGTTIDTHATVVLNGSGGKTIAPAAALADSSLYSRITPTAAACSGCHDDVTSRSHMQQNGASFYITQSLIGSSASSTETCSVCHSAGAIADVKKVHGLQ